MERVVLFSSATSILAVGLAGCGNSSVEGRDNSAQVQSIKKYLANNFGIPELMASWYPNILGVSIKGDTVIVQTNLSSAEEKIEKDLNSLRKDYHKNEIDRIKEVEKAKLDSFERSKSDIEWLLQHNKISIQEAYEEQLALIEQVKKAKLDSIDEQIKAEEKLKENYAIQPATGALSTLIASAEHICGGTSGYVFSNENPSAGLQNIQIVGANGEVLIDRRGIGDTCS